jgi:hypothetical protein
VLAGNNAAAGASGMKILILVSFLFFLAGCFNEGGCKGLAKRIDEYNRCWVDSECLITRHDQYLMKKIIDKHDFYCVNVEHP